MPKKRIATRDPDWMVGCGAVLAVLSLLACAVFFYFAVLGVQAFLRGL